TKRSFHYWTTRVAAKPNPTSIVVLLGQQVTRSPLMPVNGAEFLAKLENHANAFQAPQEIEIIAKIALSAAGTSAAQPRTNRTRSSSHGKARSSSHRPTGASAAKTRAIILRRRRFPIGRQCSFQIPQAVLNQGISQWVRADFSRLVAALQIQF